MLDPVQDVLTVTEKSKQAGKFWQLLVAVKNWLPTLSSLGSFTSSPVNSGPLLDQNRSFLESGHHIYLVFVSLPQP